MRRLIDSLKETVSFVREFISDYIEYKKAKEIRDKCPFPWIKFVGGPVPQEIWEAEFNYSFSRFKRY